MPANYVLLERIELNASAASVVFSNIPQTGYTDLKIVVSVRESSATNAGDVVGYMRFNADTGTTNYSTRAVYGDGSTVGSLTNSGGAFQIDRSTDTANTFASNEIYIPNYAGSAAKSWSSDMVTETNATGAFAAMYASLWTGTAAITTITLSPRGSLSFAANSTFSLYGLAATGTTPVIAPKASGGNIIDYDGTYWIHTFTSSGTFTPQTGLSCDYLVVAGGAGGGFASGGGGGAGGLRSTVTATGGGGSLESALSVASSTAYTVTVGAGGAGGTANWGTNGSNSVFSSITSTGGGGGGYGPDKTDGYGLAGGAGGGGGGQRGAAANAGGNGTTNQGYAGGASTTTNRYGSGGGGGAGAAGSVGGSSVSGAGGAGVATSITGTSVTRAGGGGGGGTYSQATGGAGGTGGGGAGGFNVVGVAGTVNTGGGGGGGGHSDITGIGSAGGAGGSGVVIIRYLA